MASTKESLVKNRIKKLLDTHDVYYFSPYQAGMGRAGIPDIIACLKGRFIGIEVKAGKGTTTALQDRELSRINTAGGVAVVINETNIIELENILNMIHPLKNPNQLELDL
jgi:hypothetical protein